MQPERTIIQFAATRPGLVISLALVMTLVLGFLLTRVHVTADPVNMLPKNDLFLAAVTLLSGSAALWIIPALLTILQKWLIKNQVPTHVDGNRQAKKPGNLNTCRQPEKTTAATIIYSF